MIVIIGRHFVEKEDERILMVVARLISAIINL